MKARFISVFERYLKPYQKVILLIFGVIAALTIPEIASADVDLGCSTALHNFDLGCLIGEMVLRLAVVFTFICGYILDLVTKYFVFDMHNTLTEGGLFTLSSENTPIHQVLWIMVRDLANLSFIFILIYAALSTIFSVKQSNIKRIIPQLIIAAIIMNFSLFFTQVAIDFSNYLSYQFFTAVDVVVVDENNNRQPGANVGSSADLTLSSVLMNVTRVTRLVASPQATAGDSSQELAGSGAQPGLIFGIFAALFTVIAGLVMLAGAMLLFIRFFMLLVYMIASPLAIAAMILNKPKELFFRRWWLNGLIAQLAFAPAYFALLYLSIRFLSTISATGLSSAGDGGLFAYWVQTAFIFIISSAFLIYSIVAAKQISSTFGGGMSKAFQSLAGRADKFVRRNSYGRVAGGAGYIGRNTVGRAGLKLADSKRFNRLANSGNVIAKTFGRKVVTAGEKTGEKSFDLRGKYKGLGTEKKGGLAGAIKDQAREDMKFNKKAIATLSEKEKAKKDKLENKYKHYENAQLVAEKAYQKLNDPNVNVQKEYSQATVLSNTLQKNINKNKQKIEDETTTPAEKERLKKLNQKYEAELKKQKKELEIFGEAKRLLDSEGNKDKAKEIAIKNANLHRQKRDKVGHELRSEFGYLNTVATRGDKGLFESTFAMLGGSIKGLATGIDKLRSIGGDVPETRTRESYDKLVSSLRKLQSRKFLKWSTNLDSSQEQKVDELKKQNAFLSSQIKAVEEGRTSDELSGAEKQRIEELKDQIKANNHEIVEEFRKAGSYISQQRSETIKKEASKTPNDKLLEALEGVKISIEQTGKKQIETTISEGDQTQQKLDKIDDDIYGGPADNLRFGGPIDK